MSDFDANSKSPAAPMTWFKLYQDAWIEGTRDLPLELRAVYFDCLCLIYKHDAPIARSDEWMSFYLHISTRKWRSVRCKLVALGKLVETEAGLINGRAEKEVTSRAVRPSKAVRVRGESGVKQPGNNLEYCEKPNENNKTDQQSKSKIVEVEEEIDRSSSSLPLEQEARADDDFDFSDCGLDRLKEAAGPCLIATSPAIAKSTVLRQWREAGLDFDLDVLPTVRAVAGRVPAGSVQAWGYFTREIELCHRQRIAGVPVTGSRISAAAQSMAETRKLVALYGGRA